MKIRVARNADLPAIRELWKCCFHDSDDYLDLYFSKRFCARKTPLAFVDKKLIGMVHLLPCTVFPQQKALYWYAACIHPDFRKMGYFRSLVKTVLNHSKTAGFTNICLPTPGLEDLYQNLGFTYTYYIKETHFSDVTLMQNISIKKANAHDFLKLLKIKLGGAVWNESDVQYAIEENQFCNGDAIKFLFQQKTFVALGIRKDDGIIIENTNMDIEVAKACQGNILEYFNSQKMILRQSPKNDNASGLTPHGQSDSPIEIGANLTFSLS